MLTPSHIFRQLWNGFSKRDLDKHKENNSDELSQEDIGVAGCANHRMHLSFPHSINKNLLNASIVNLTT